MHSADSSQAALGLIYDYYNQQPRKYAQPQVQQIPQLQQSPTVASTLTTKAAAAVSVKSEPSDSFTELKERI